MKQIVLDMEYGLVEINASPMASSRIVAERFNKQHKDVLRSIEHLDVDSEFGRRNFTPTSYKDQWNRKQKEYLMTKDGFTLLVMGFTGKKAMQFKIAYINRFNEMEQFIKTKDQARLGHPAFTDGVKLLHDKPAPYHFSNESDMINRLVLGMSAKQFKDLHGISKSENSIRPYLTLEQIEEIEHLQMLDSGMMAARVSYDQRKMALELSLMKFREKRVR